MPTGPFRPAIGSQVKDIYGRELGRVIGYSLDLAGSLSAIGVESGSQFREYRAECIASLAENVIVTKPEWKVKSERLGMEKGILEKRIAALEKMVQSGEIQRNLYDELSKSLAAIKGKHAELGEALVRRLHGLQEMDDKVEEFMARVEVQGISEELGADPVRWTTGHCLAIKAMNGAERLEITELIGAVGKEDEDTLPAEAMKATEEANDLLQQASDLLQARESDTEAGQHPGGNTLS